METTSFDSRMQQRFVGFWLGPETLSLYLTKRTGRAEGKAIPVNALIDQYPGTVLQKGTKIGPDRVAFAWQVGDARGGAAGPRLSPNEIDINVKALDDIHFRSMTMTMIK